MAILSMTGYGSALSSDGYLVEVRSLNGRYLDINLKLPWELFRFEHKIRDIIKKFFERGSVEVLISKKTAENQTGILRLNRHYAKQYVNILKEFSKISGKEIDYSILPGVKELIILETDDKGLKRIAKGVFKSVETALKNARAMRVAEGRVIKRTLTKYLRDIKRICNNIERKLMDQNRQMRFNLEKKVEELSANSHFDKNRFEMEILYFINRLDISEEIERISSHLEQFSALIAKNLPVGRRLDFLCQELLREFNTIGSKSTLISIKRLVIEGKDIVEKLREQVQNVE